VSAAARRRELGHASGDVFVPQVNAPAFSWAAFAMASPVETQQAFLEGHADAFDWFGGVFEEVRYDNLGSAVKKVLKTNCARPTSSLRSTLAPSLRCSQLPTSSHSTWTDERGPVSVARSQQSGRAPASLFSSAKRTTASRRLCSAPGKPSNCDRAPCRRATSLSFSLFSIRRATGRNADRLVGPLRQDGSSDSRGTVDALVVERDADDENVRRLYGADSRGVALRSSSRTRS
jgi:hypothetical protein